MKPRILVAGIGNIFRGDDGFGVEVAGRLAKQRFQEGVEVVDFGTRGLDFAYSLLYGHYDVTIIIDIMICGKEPGTLRIIEPEMKEPEMRESEIKHFTPGLQNYVPMPQEPPFLDHQGIDPYRMLHWAKRMGANLKLIRLITCEPQNIASDDDLAMGLSPPTLLAADAAVKLVESLIEDFTERASIECNDMTLHTGNYA